MELVIALKKWIKSMIDEMSEFEEKIIRHRSSHKVEELELYQIMKRRIEKDNSDENIIFFFPFPIVHEESRCIFGQFASDILSNIYDALNKNKIIGSKKIYALYPTLDNKIAIRLLNSGVREWFPSSVLNEFIKYDTKFIK